MIEGVFFPLLHECDYLGHLIRQPLIKNSTLLPWVEGRLFLNCFSNLFHTALSTFGLMESELLLKHLSPHIPPSSSFKHPLHFPVGWPITMQMLASDNVNVASPDSNTELFGEAYAARQTGMKFLHLHDAAMNDCSLQPRAVCGESDWHTPGERHRASSMSRCGIVRANKSSQTRRSAGARGNLRMTFIPKCSAPFAPAGANVQHTQKQPHEWNLVQVQHEGFSLMYPWCQKRMLAKCISTIDRNVTQSPPNKLDLVVYALKSFSCQILSL